MEEQRGKRLIRKKFNLESVDAAQSTTSYKRTRSSESQHTSPPSVHNLTHNFLLPPPAPVAKVSANPFAQTRHTNARDQLEDSDLDSGFVMQFARVQV